jgi:hypothetical protein
MTREGATLAGWRRRVLTLFPIVLLAPGCFNSGSDDVGSAAARSASAFNTPDRPGSLVQADALGNTVIGGSARTALAFRFRATWTGSVVGVRVYVIKNVNGRTGYSAGDGGTMRVALHADSGGRRHVPAGGRLAATTFRPRDHGFWPLVRFAEAGRVVAGRLYHVVFTNIDSRPASNYVSINALYSASRLGRGPAVPNGLAVLAGSSAGSRAEGWELRGSRPNEHYLPILDVVGRRAGHHDGLGYMEVWDAKPIGGDAAVRQLIRIGGSQPMRVEGAWLRVRRTEGRRVPLRLRIERPDGEVLASASVAPGDVPTSDPGWVHVRFAEPARIEPGTDVALTAVASGRAYEAFPIRKGADFGFDRSTMFNGGYAQFDDGDGWAGWDQWGGHDQRTSDLQFALEAVR